VIRFDEPSDHYHANAAIGSGDIRRMIRSARLYADGIDGLCERESDALKLGIAAHMALLEPDRFAVEYAVKPAGMSFAKKDGIAWRAAQGGKAIIAADDEMHLRYMRDRMPAEVAAIFGLCRKEATVRTEIDGLAVQCRPDLWNIEAGAFYDLKTIPSLEGITRAVWEHMLYVQVPWYARLIERETGRPIKVARLIFVEKEPPYRWRIVELDSDYMELGSQAIDDALAQIHARMRSGCWDDAADLNALVRIPEWKLPALTVNADGGIDL
jgi:exodeoxyribonuclease VIII